MRIVLKGNGRRIVLRQTGARGQTGPVGPQGVQGPQGVPGQDGEGLPTGGTSGQVPVKQSSSDFDIAWETPPEAPVTSVNGQTGVVVLDAGDVGADPSGSAAQALSDANDYTDEKVDNVNTGVVTVAASDSPQGVKDKADFVCTGTNDQTTIAQAFSAASTLARPRVDLAGGQFNISQRIVIPSQGVLRGAGISATAIFMSNGSTQEAIRALNVSDIEIHDLHIEGNAENRGENTNATVLIQGVDRAHLTNLSIGNVMHHGMEVSFGSKDILIEDCFINGTRGDGLEIERATDITLNRCRMWNIGSIPYADNDQYAIELEFVAQNIVVNDCDFRNVNWGFVSSLSEADTVDIAFNRCRFDNSNRGFLYANGQGTAPGTVFRAKFNDCEISNVIVDIHPILELRVESFIYMNNCNITNAYQMMRHYSVPHGNSIVDLRDIKGQDVGNFAMAGSTNSITLRLIDSHLRFTSPDKSWFPTTPDNNGIWFHRDSNAAASRILDVRGTILEDSPAGYVFRTRSDDDITFTEGTKILNLNAQGVNSHPSAFQFETASAGITKARLSLEISGDIDFGILATNGFVNNQPPEGTDIAVYNYDFSGVNVRAFRPGDDTNLENLNSRFRLGTGFGND